VREEDLILDAASTKLVVDTLASQELQRRLNPFPRGDVRYVSTLEERIEDLQKVTLDQVKSFHAQFYGASDAKFVVSGQFDTAQLQKLAAELLGNWKSPGPYTRVPSIFVKAEPGNQKIETSGKR
jgi:zinc protease